MLMLLYRYFPLTTFRPAANIFIEAGLDSGGNVLVHWFVAFEYSVVFHYIYQCRGQISIPCPSFGIHDVFFRR